MEKSVISRMHQRRNRIFGITFAVSIINLDRNVFGLIAECEAVSCGQDELRRHQGAEASLCGPITLQISIINKKKKQPQVSCEQDCTQKCKNSDIRDQILHVDTIHIITLELQKNCWSIHLHYNWRHPRVHFPGAVFSKCLIIFVKTAQTNDFFFICGNQISVREKPASAKCFSLRGEVSVGGSIPMISSKVSCKFEMSDILKKWLPPVPAVSGFRSES